MNKELLTVKKIIYKQLTLSQKEAAYNEILKQMKLSIITTKSLEKLN